MRALVQERYGSADDLKLRDIERPAVGDDDVLIRVYAAGVDPGVWHIMTGLPYMIRIMGYGFRAPKDRTLGTDVAGRIEAVGKDVTQLRAGDDVFGACRGSFAEYACGKEKNLLPKPQNLSFVQAAAVHTSALTALQGLRDKGEVQAGHRVLVIGAAGGVGSFAVQLAKAFGAEVTGVCSTTKVELVRSLGAEHVVDYTREDFADRDERYDVILDTAGNRALSQLRRALTRSGTLVIVGGERGGRWMGGTDRQLRALVLSPLVRHKLRSFVATSRKQDLQFLKEVIEEGQLTPVIDRMFSLSEAPEAIRHLEGGHARGKSVIVVRGSEEPT